ncbi:hypothetical protein BD309DRAFT_449167 [Dichomitus squalens]|nr:hypothetical protein BD309DRAFT_449167 [Dichomitus squalens]
MIGRVQSYRVRVQRGLALPSRHAAPIQATSIPSTRTVGVLVCRCVCPPLSSKSPASWRFPLRAPLLAALSSGEMRSGGAAAGRDKTDVPMPLGGNPVICRETRDPGSAEGRGTAPQGAAIIVIPEVHFDCGGSNGGVEGERAHRFPGELAFFSHTRARSSVCPFSFARLGTAACPVPTGRRRASVRLSDWPSTAVVRSRNQPTSHGEEPVSIACLRVLHTGNSGRIWSPYNFRSGKSIEAPSSRPENRAAYGHSIGHRIGHTPLEKCYARARSCGRLNCSQDLRCACLPFYRIQCVLPSAQ